MSTLQRRAAIVVAFAVSSAVSAGLLAMVHRHDRTLSISAVTSSSVASKAARRTIIRYVNDPATGQLVPVQVEAPAGSSGTASNRGPVPATPSHGTGADPVNTTTSTRAPRRPKPTPAGPGATTTTTTVAAPPTTVAAPPTTVAVTTTTRPRGVPADWPADKPIPPMPANCREPQLEDNGVWNCQH